MSKIRKAEKEEYPLLVEIWDEAVRATHGFLAPEDFMYYKSRMPEYLERAAPFVYEENGTIKGFTSVTGDNIDMLFVGERGAGIGTELLLFAIKEAGGRRLDVNEQNGMARRFYENAGFTCERRSPLDGCGKPYPVLHMVLKDR